MEPIFNVEPMFCPPQADIVQEEEFGKVDTVCDGFSRGDGLSTV